MNKGIHNHQLKIACINDISGFGRCSITAELPIISRLGVQCCPLPTALLSDHTGFDSFYFFDFTDHMRDYMKEWKKLGLHFEGIMSGFLGSVEQIDIVREFFDEFDDDGTCVIIDPVMGDYGKIYATYTDEMCEQMKQLVGYADILTPKATEACKLTGIPYKEDFTSQELMDMAERLSSCGPEKVAITGVDRDGYIENYCYEKGGRSFIIRTEKVATQRSGTGDVFSAVIAAGAVRGIPFEKSVRTAAEFIRDCLVRSEELDIPVTDGVCFEELMDRLSFDR